MLAHEVRWFRPDSLCCRTHDTHWIVRREQGRDLRLAVAAGPPDLLGQGMALAAWYGEM
ncbi:MAG: hypothetical protein ACK2T0_15270 [Anaerolineales bacterium]